MAVAQVATSNKAIRAKTFFEGAKNRLVDGIIKSFSKNKIQNAGKGGDEIKLWHEAIANKEKKLVAKVANFIAKEKKLPRNEFLEFTKTMKKLINIDKKYNECKNAPLDEEINELRKIGSSYVKTHDGAAREILIEFEKDLQYLHQLEGIGYSHEVRATAGDMLEFFSLAFKPLPETIH